MEDLSGESHCVRLEDALYGSIVGLKAFYDLIDSDGYNDLCIVLKILLDRLEADLDKVGEVIATNLGAVEIEVALEMIRRTDQTYYKGDFMRAIIEPAKRQTAPQDNA
jgi:hypothetical protein